MRYQIYLQLMLAATVITTATATGQVAIPILPTVPLPESQRTTPYPPLKPGEVPVCSNLNVHHSGFNASQEGGDVLLPKRNEDPQPTPSSQNVQTTTTKFTETTVNTTTTTEVKTITTTTKTTIDSTTTSTNATTALEPCVEPLLSDGKQYNWWQILLDTGGKPGTLKGKQGPQNLTETPSEEPCERPLGIINYDLYTYTYKDSDLKTHYRQETSYPRFYGTSKQFSDVRGYIVWTPPPSANDTRVYSASYIYDDTGFWVFVDHKSCQFDEEQKSLYCNDLPTCDCINGQLQCNVPYGVGPNLLASLVG